MANPIYPAGLPLPLRNDYGFEPVNNIRRTEQDSGRARQRIEFRNTPDLISLSFIFDATEAMLFTAWADQVALGVWFDMTLVTPMGFEVQEIRFTRKYSGGQLRGRYAWEYTQPCEVRKPLRLDDGWAELLPDWILEADIIDYAVNREWPLFEFDFPTYAAAIAGITTLRDGIQINIDVDENNGGRHAVYTVQRADGPSLVLDFMGDTYQSGHATDNLILVQVYG